MKISIGIDIGTEFIKVVCVENAKDGYKLSGFGKIAYKGDKGRLRKFLDDNGVPVKDVRVNIEDPNIKVRRVDMPEMPAEELPEAIKWAMKNVVEGDIENFSFRYIDISSEDVAAPGKKPYLVFAIKNEAITRHIELMGTFGFKTPQVIEPDSGALNNIFTFTKSSRETTDVLIDFGSSVSLFTVMGKSGLLFSRPLVGCGDSHLVDQIARDMGVDIAKAMEFRRAHFAGERLDLGEESLKLLGNTVAHFFSKIAIEVQRSIDGFMLTFGKRKINTIYLCGGGAYYTGLIKYLRETLGIGCELFDPFEKIDTSAYPPEHIEKNKAAYAIACGLAIE